MAEHKDVALGGTVYFWGAANNTSGSGADADSGDFNYDVRLAGGGAADAPIASGTGTLLTHANYPAGAYEVAISTSGPTYVAGNEYAVYATLLVDSQNPAGFLGSFVVRAASSTLADLVAAIAVDVAGLDGAAMRGTDSAALASAWTATRAGYLDELDAATDGAVAEIVKTVLLELSNRTNNSSLHDLLGVADEAGATVLTKIAAGAVASVTGNVGGNVTGSIGSLATQAKADVQAEAADALNAAIPGTPITDSINERIKAIDDLTQASGAGDLAALWTRVQAISDADSVILDAAQRTAIGDAVAAINLASGTVDYEAIADASATVGALLAACRMILVGKMTAPSGTTKAYMEVDGATTGLTVVHASDYTTRNAPT